jgi:hypothetical protein
MWANPLRVPAVPDRHGYVLTADEARRIALAIARLPELLGRAAAGVSGGE